MRRTPLPARLAAALATASLAACAASSPGAQAQTLADQITRAVYADDLAGVTANFDDTIKKSITPGSLGDLSDHLRTLGTYQGLHQRTADPTSGRYQYDATFSGGMLLVELRLDSQGKVDAYRIAPGPGPAGPGGQ
ncbi:MAG: hypothetical protein ACREM2_10185 [Vulcanimicrobiaceae bacterium]